MIFKLVAHYYNKIIKQLSIPASVFLVAFYSSASTENPFFNSSSISFGTKS